MIHDMEKSNKNRRLAQSLIKIRKKEGTGQAGKCGQDFGSKWIEALSGERTQVKITWS